MWTRKEVLVCKEGHGRKSKGEGRSLQGKRKA